MIIEYIIVATFILIGLYLIKVSIGRFASKKRISAISCVSLSIPLILTGTILGAFILDKSTYQRLTKEHTVATIEFEKISPQHFRAIVKPSHKKIHTLEIYGDQWQMDALIVKWSGPAEWAGLKPLYRLERLAGRYKRIEEELASPKSVHSLSSGMSQSLWDFIVEYQTMVPWLDTVYGNATYMPMADGAKFMIAMSKTGLIARPRNLEASQSIQNWNV